MRKCKHRIDPLSKQMQYFEAELAFYSEQQTKSISTNKIQKTAFS